MSRDESLLVLSGLTLSGMTRVYGASHTEGRRLSMTINKFEKKNLFGPGLAVLGVGTRFKPCLEPLVVLVRCCRRWVTAR